jgi:hypothetical protein
MTRTRLWVLGAPDPEMEAIERLLREVGETVAYATVNGVRVHPGNAYAAQCLEAQGYSGHVYEIECAVDVLHGAPHVGVDSDATVTRIDHHRPDDLGYGLPPARFLLGSSIGQVIAECACLHLLPPTWRRVARTAKESRHSIALYDDVVHGAYGFGYAPWSGEWAIMVGFPWSAVIPREIIYVAAADHCLAAAYRGECLGVDPDALMRWRVETCAAHQGRPFAGGYLP